MQLNAYPEIFLVGAPKCGTTSIFNFFNQHPEIFVPNIKEPHYFSTPEVANNFYNVKLVSDPAEYVGLYASCEKGLKRADCSPSYLSYSKACSRIYEVNPDAKILAILRDPIKRAISHYLMDVRFGVQNVDLIECLNFPDLHPMSYREYVTNGLYSSQIQNYLDLFPKKNVMVLIFDDLEKDTESTMRKIFEFLEVDPFVFIDYRKRANTGAQHRYNFIRNFISSEKWQTLRHLLPKTIRHIMRQTLLKANPRIPNQKLVTGKLLNIFQSDIVNLTKMLDRDLSNWLQH